MTRAWGLALLALLASSALAAPPRLYRQPNFQSPVSGGPDDLLLLAGDGFAAGDEVAYSAVADTRRGPTVPRLQKALSAAESGWAPVVSYDHMPFSLTIRLPETLRPHRSYALWVRHQFGEWSAPVLINDARPLWATPAMVYSSRAIASLPREIKVIGRNLEPFPGRQTRIRLDGPEHYVHPAIADSLSSATLDPYVARLQLPSSLRPGHYHIAISRDGISWVALAGQMLEVRDDPAATREFSLDNAKFGGCRANDGLDDTQCLVRALEAAKNAGGGTVVLGPGVWDLMDIGKISLAPENGVIVPVGVNLQGAGKDRTSLVRHTDWNNKIRLAAAITALGRNRIDGLTLRDEKRYRETDEAGAFLRLGGLAVRSPADGMSRVDDVIVTNNLFENTWVAIGNDGLPMNRLFIAYNTFAAFHAALELAGNQENTAIRYRIDDSVIDHNIFKTSSNLDLRQKSANIATEIGAGFRVDFSDNFADGADTAFLYDAGDPTGWRAAFFWNLSDSVENSLISHNSATCTGDKIGDGEAISLDNNANTFAFQAAAVAAAATPDSVSVAQMPISRQHQREVPVATYYIGHWTQLPSGPGLGQVRRIVGYSTNPRSGVITFKVAPVWDVLPVAGRTRVAVGREFRQVYVLDNLVDNRTPLCKKSNRSRHNAGVISMWGQSTDSVIAGNRQYDSDGIFVQQVYSVADPPCSDCAMQSSFQFFLDIHDNLVDGEYDWNSNCSASGIAVGIGASTSGDLSPPTLGYGVSIAHNQVRHADAQFSGAIAQTSSWSSGPPPHHWPLSENLLIHHNQLSDIDGSAGIPACGKSRPRVAISFPDDPVAWHSVLYANSCNNVATALGPGSIASTVICRTPIEGICGCTVK